MQSVLRSLLILCILCGLFSTSLFAVDNASKPSEAYLDATQGLIWQAESPGEMTWLEGVHYCNQLDLGGYSSWRMPLQEELVSYATNGLAASGRDRGSYWTLSLKGGDSAEVWTVDIGTGSSALMPQDSEGVAVRCVVETREAIYLPLLKRWAVAWSNQNVDDYLACYGEAFEPSDGQARSEWEKVRRKRLTGPSYINIELSEVKVVSESDEQTEVMFLQSYRANHYQDQVVKVLTIGVENGELVILNEQSVADVK